MLFQNNLLEADEIASSSRTPFNDSNRGCYFNSSISSLWQIRELEGGRSVGGGESWENHRSAKLTWERERERGRGSKLAAGGEGEAEWQKHVGGSGSAMLDWTMALRANQDFPSFLLYLLHFLLHQLVLLDYLLVAALLLLLVLLPLPGVVRVLPDEEDLGHEDEAHGEEAAEEVGHRDEAEGSVLLITWVHNE